VPVDALESLGLIAAAVVTVVVVVAIFLNLIETK